MALILPFACVAFDLDGTLVDTGPDLTASLNHALVELGRPPVPEASVRVMVGHGARKLLERGHSLAEAYPIPAGLRPYYERFLKDGSLPTEAEVRGG